MSDVSYTVFSFLIIGLIVLFFVSFAFFIRRINVNSARNRNSSSVDKKLDKIIKLLQKDQNK